jgi:hypothetical protein
MVIDKVFEKAIGPGLIPGVVTLAADDSDVVYEGAFGRRAVDRPDMRASCEITTTESFRTLPVRVSPLSSATYLRPFALYPWQGHSAPGVFPQIVHAFR